MNKFNEMKKKKTRMTFHVCVCECVCAFCIWIIFNNEHGHCIECKHTDTQYINDDDNNIWSSLSLSMTKYWNQSIFYETRTIIVHHYYRNFNLIRHFLIFDNNSIQLISGSFFEMIQFTKYQGFSGFFVYTICNLAFIFGCSIMQK